ncbi:MAG: hypothetical protein DRQ97_01335 [Gammaproteobacteria bacterium]|nr:MAG: hypothetical protein DRQ97_01335 [Gammaproteobacteria bacterium]
MEIDTVGSIAILVVLVLLVVAAILYYSYTPTWRIEMKLVVCMDGDLEEVRERLTVAEVHQIGRVTEE